jgi:peptidoglycan/LPS O-acetylase OafA/YrhL
MNALPREQDTTPNGRIHWLDNLRTCMIFLVVLVHAGGVYEGSGIWASFWIVDDPATNDLSGLIILLLDIFMMPMIFFISGYVTPRAVTGRSGWSFIKSKIKRLLLPWAIAVLTLIPLYKVIFLGSRRWPQENWTTYFHWSNGIWDQNWLWFLPVLFGFNMIYLLLKQTRLRGSTLPVKASLPVAFLLGIGYSLCIDWLGLWGWTKTLLIDFQNDRLLIYLLAFLMGAHCFTRQVFAGKPTGNRLYIAMHATVWLPVTTYVVFLLYPLFNPGQYLVSGAAHRVILWSSYHVSLLGLMVLMIETARRYLDKPGTAQNLCNQTSYGVYIIHVIVTGVLAWLLLNTRIPSLAKHLLLSVATYTVSVGIVNLYHKIIHLHLNWEIPLMKKCQAMFLVLAILIVGGCKHRDTTVPAMDLHTAVATGTMEAVQQHIDAGSDLNEREPTVGSTPLITAAVFGRTAAAQSLMDAGADVNLQNRDGSTALITAAFFCRTEIVQALLNHGADTTIKNNVGRTAWDSVSRPFDEVKGIYDGLGALLAPMGLQLDYDRLKTTRPHIAEMLQ